MLLLLSFLLWCSDDRRQNTHRYSMMHHRLTTAGIEVEPHYNKLLVMRRASEASLFFHCLPRKKKPLHNGSYDHRVPKKNQNTILYQVCVIQHRNWPPRSTILNAHGTNASPDGLCIRTHTNEAFSCWFCCNSFRVDRAKRGNVCLEACLGRV